MKKEPYYLSIFNHIVREIYMGRLKVGDRLPSTRILCDRYAAGTNTVINVVKLLAESGFVETSRGRATVIVSDCGSMGQALRHLREQQTEIAETYEIIRVFLPSMVFHSVQRFQEPDIVRTREIVNELERYSRDINAFRELKSIFIHHLLSGTRNTKMLEIFQNAEEAIILPRMASDMLQRAEVYLSPARLRYAQQMRSIPDYLEKGAFQQVKEEIADAYGWVGKTIVEAVHGCLAGEEDIQETERNKKQPRSNFLYTSVLSAILNQIYEGIYQEGDFLPPENALCDQYGVSLTTVRRVNHILNEIGMAKTINGRGTQITLFSDFDMDNVMEKQRMIALLSSYFEAMELLSVTAEDLAAYAGRRISTAGRDALEEKLRSLRIHKNNRLSTPIILLQELVRVVDSMILDEYYIGISNDLPGGLFLERFTDNLEEVREKEHFDCLEALQELAAGRVAAFASRFAQVLNTLLVQSKIAFKLFSGIELL